MEQGGEATQNSANSVRDVGGDNVDGHPDSVPDRAATTIGAGHHLVPTTKGAEVAAAVAPSLALLDSVLAMAPSHQTALRCRASILTRLGRAPDALIAANQAVSAAETAVRAADARPAAAVSAGGESNPGRRHPSDEPVSAEADLGAPSEATVGLNGHRAAVGADSEVGGGESDGAQRWSSAPKSIGFMRSSKVNLVVGGLLLTGGGRACTLDFAKSLVLRGCLRQKMGRRKQAEDDYRQALRICHHRLREIEGRHRNHGTELNISNSDSSQTVIVDGGNHGGAVRGRGSIVGEGCGGRTHGRIEGGEKQGATLDGKMGDAPDDAKSFSHDGVTKPVYIKDPPASRGSRKVCKSAVDMEGSSTYQGGRCEVLELESLIHHNLATVHLATVIGTDTRVSFHKVRATAVQDCFLMRMLVSILPAVEVITTPPPHLLHV